MSHLRPIKEIVDEFEYCFKPEIGSTRTEIDRYLAREIFLESAIKQRDSEWVDILESKKSILRDMKSTWNNELLDDIIKASKE